MLMSLPPVEAAYRVDPASRAAVHRQGRVVARCRDCGGVIGDGYASTAGQGGLCRWCKQWAEEEAQSLRAK